MARVVMLTAAAGPGLDLQYGDIFETDQATADRLISIQSAREVTAEDKDAPVKRDAAAVVGNAETHGAQRQPAVEPVVGGSDEVDEADDEDPVEQPASKPVAPRRATSRRR